MYTLFKPYGSIAWEKENLHEFVDVIGVSATPAPASELEAGLEACDILVGDVDITIDKALISKAPKLKAVLCTSVGVDYVDAEALNERGVILANNPDFCVVAVAEYAMGLIYALLRRIPAGTEAVGQGKWQERNRLGGPELCGRNLGIVAFGRIGRDLARQAKGIGMNVFAYDAFMDEASAKNLGVTPVPLDTLLKQSDIVSIHAPLNEHTRHLIGANEIAAMRDGAYLINAARGGVLDETALLAALTGGKLAGAALDVLEQEPPPADHPLLRAAKEHNLILTPHIGWHSFDASEKALRCLKQQVQAVVKGLLPNECLNAAHIKVPR
jgi:phosphoglycerate dehydrogenase-like enzyme